MKVSVGGVVVSGGGKIATPGFLVDVAIELASVPCPTSRPLLGLELRDRHLLVGLSIGTFRTALWLADD